jgi:hypothetical protein
MVNVTLGAKQELLRRKADQPPESRHLTLRIVPGGLDEPVLLPDIRRVEDEVVEHLGTPVLLVARDMARIIGEMVIDCRPDLQGTRLVLRGNRGSTSGSGIPECAKDDTGSMARETRVAAPAAFGAAPPPRRRLSERPRR